MGFFDERRWQHMVCRGQAFPHPEPWHWLVTLQPSPMWLHVKFALHDLAFYRCESAEEVSSARYRAEASASRAEKLVRSPTMCAPPTTKAQTEWTVPTTEPRSFGPAAPSCAADNALPRQGSRWKRGRACSLAPALRARRQATKTAPQTRKGLGG